MKELVIEQLQQRDLAHIFNEHDFKIYVRKSKQNGKGNNKYLEALNILDLFILNSAA
jgi:hypothetical protein